MTEDQTTSRRFVTRRNGLVICLICRGENLAHDPTCPVAAMDTQVKEITSHVGMFIANMRDALDAIGKILRDERWS